MAFCATEYSLNFSVCLGVKVSDSISSDIASVTA